MTLLFRQATAADTDLLADLVLGEPEQETTRVAMLLYDLADFGLARALFRLLWRAGKNWKLSEVALMDGRPAGVLQTGGSSIRVTPAFILAAFRKLGARRLLHMRSRLRIQRRVSPDKPPGAYVISEIHVAPEFRGRGLGEAILRHAEEDARILGFDVMALHTLATNPARGLYGRFGFEAVAERRDPEFQRMTGVPGNVLFVKRI
jgi:ribosomal protein S18 acetylase RimI-like enzyme